MYVSREYNILLFLTLKKLKMLLKDSSCVHLVSSEKSYCYQHVCFIWQHLFVLVLLSVIWRSGLSSYTFIVDFKLSTILVSFGFHCMVHM